MARSTKRMVDEVVRGYLGAALWTGTDDDDEPLDRTYDIYDFDKNEVRKLRGQIVSWIRKNKSAINDFISHVEGEGGYDSLGHDLLLTSCGHGTGFWDRRYGGKKHIGERLTKAAKAFGEKWFHVGDDGKVHIG